MFAIPNKIVIGDVESPILTFENDAIKEVLEETGISAVGEELYIDQFMPTVRYALYVRYQILPQDNNVYDGILSADGKIICSKWNYDIRDVPYGTPTRFFNDGRQTGAFYCESVTRESGDLFKFNCVSAVGMMDNQRHVGGVYTGQRFDVVLAEILGTEYEYEIDPEVASQQVYGWLPYDTRRNNLHQLLVAYGVIISKSDTGKMLFIFLSARDTYDIPRGRIFDSGSIKYGDTASRVEVTEHSYHYLSSTEEETLYDTQGKSLAQTTVTFDHPIYPDSITASGDMTISEKGTNYAIIQGSGILTGKPYVHNTKLLVEENSDARIEKVVTVKDATLITTANSENCLARISSYYFNTTVVTQAIVVDEERVGRRYNIENPFKEKMIGFLSRMLTNTSSFRRAECDFITNYTPAAGGSSFARRAVLELTDTEQRWDIPGSVFQKDAPQIRCVLIGRGSDGATGENGETGGYGNDSAGGAGGKGGKGGKGGAGGKVYSVTIDCESLAFIRYKNVGGNTVLYAADDIYSSANGSASSSGFVELFSGAVYALPGNDGVSGADGGNGGCNPAIGASPQRATDGGDLVYNGVTYKGGKGGKMQAVRARSYSTAYHENMTWRFGGNGGGGAAAGANGHDATNLTGGNGDFEWPVGGAGADATETQPTVELYGSGGNGGSGGGGGGGASNHYWWNDVYNVLITTYTQEESNIPGKGGKGSAGTAGYKGCLIIYY
jgi:hypothetical protein|nr:MAG TPA: Intron-binding protein aquarius N-terminus [Caudoviricetes sp.]